MDSWAGSAAGVPWSERAASGCRLIREVVPCLLCRYWGAVPTDVPSEATRAFMQASACRWRHSPKCNAHARPPPPHTHSAGQGSALPPPAASVCNPPRPPAAAAPPEQKHIPGLTFVDASALSWPAWQPPLVPDEEGWRQKDGCAEGLVCVVGGGAAWGAHCGGGGGLLRPANSLPCLLPPRCSVQLAVQGISALGCTLPRGDVPGQRCSGSHRPYRAV